MDRQRMGSHASGLPSCKERQRVLPEHNSARKHGDAHSAISRSMPQPAYGPPTSSCPIFELSGACEKRSAAGMQRSDVRARAKTGV